jgi:hypothetical protein
VVVLALLSLNLLSPAKHHMVWQAHSPHWTR